MFLGRRQLPSDLSAFELEAFLTFVGSERRAIEERRQPALKLGLALQIGFLRMTGAARGGRNRPAGLVAALGRAAAGHCP